MFLLCRERFFFFGYVSFSLNISVVTACWGQMRWSGQAVLELHSFGREMCCAGKQPCLSRSKQAGKTVVLSALKNKSHLDHLDRNYLQWIQSLINVASLINHSAFQDFNLTTFLDYSIAFALPIWCAFLLNSVNRFLTELRTEKKQEKKKRII